MPKFFIEQIEDPRLDRFRDLRMRNPTRYGKYFIAEGRLVVERLLKSRHRTLAVLVEQDKEEALLQWVKPETEVLCLPPRMIEELVGFDFHRGVMACGERTTLPKVIECVDSLKATEVIVAAYEVQDPTNLGNMIRTAVAFGSNQMILGPRTADPFSRRVMRVSMGTALEVQFIESDDFAAELKRLDTEYGIPSIAATLADDAFDLWRVPRKSPSIVVLGNEGAGLPHAIQQSCTYRATIPMSEIADSLNVSVATGIFLYELMRKSPLPAGVSASAGAAGVPASAGAAGVPASAGPAGVPASAGPAGVPASAGPAGVPASAGPRSPPPASGRT